jgi:hypothetical protein
MKHGDLSSKQFRPVTLCPCFSTGLPFPAYFTANTGILYRDAIKNDLTELSGAICASLLDVQYGTQSVR